MSVLKICAPNHNGLLEKGTLFFSLFLVLFLVPLWCSLLQRMGGTQKYVHNNCILLFNNMYIYIYVQNFYYMRAHLSKQYLILSHLIYIYICMYRLDRYV